MTKEEFIKKYCWAPTSASDCHQITWDLLENIQESFGEAVGYVETQLAIGEAKYDVDVLLEVVDKDLPDYAFLKELKRGLEELS